METLSAINCASKGLRSVFISLIGQFILAEPPRSGMSAKCSYSHTGHQCGKAPIAEHTQAKKLPWISGQASIVAAKGDPSQESP